MQQHRLWYGTRLSSKGSTEMHISISISYLSQPPIAQSLTTECEHFATLECRQLHSTINYDNLNIIIHSLPSPWLHWHLLPNEGCFRLLHHLCRWPYTCIPQVGHHHASGSGVCINFMYIFIDITLDIFIYSQGYEGSTAIEGGF